ncbi:MAG: hypothetical protein CL840_01745 [Crocinitomicaceae bacterium]|nr:hypothetical protein [Crocinitomicaceae bacterium]
MAQDNCSTYYPKYNSSIIKCEFEDKSDLLIVMDCQYSKILDIKYFTLHMEFLECTHKDSIKAINLPPFTYIARTSKDSVWYSILDSAIQYGKMRENDYRIDTLIVKDLSVIKESSIKFYKGLPRRFNHSLLNQDSSKTEMEKGVKHGSEILYYHISDVKSQCIEDNFLMKELTIWEKGEPTKPKLEFEVNGMVKQLPNSSQKDN